MRKFGLVFILIAVQARAELVYSYRRTVTRDDLRTYTTYEAFGPSGERVFSLWREQTAQYPNPDVTYYSMGVYSGVALKGLMIDANTFAKLATDLRTTLPHDTWIVWRTSCRLSFKDGPSPSTERLCP